MPARVLIADDNPAVRTALCHLLARPDRELFEAEDGADAVSKALEHSPDVAILDLAMPTMDGLAAAREISSRLPQVALVMCTMHWSPQLQLEAMKWGIRSVISKADSGLLISTVDELLASRASSGVAPSASPAILPTETLPTAPAIESDASSRPEPAAPAAEVPSGIPLSKLPEQ